MKNPLRSFFVAVVFCVAAVSSWAAGGSHAVSVETVRGLKLSGYSDDALGGLQWRLEADSADADSDGVSRDMRFARWRLRGLKLSTFTKDGRAFAEMTSPEGVFLPEKKSANSDARVEVKGENFFVRGNGWSWEGRHGSENFIRVRENVFVSLSSPEKKDPLTALSDTLSVHGEEARTVLIFSGNVKVSYGEIFMTCDALEIFVDGKGGNVVENADGGKNALSGNVRRIVGSGNVEIKRGSARISGETAEFSPNENSFSVNGNARLDDSGAQLSVSGDRAVGKTDSRFVEVFAADPASAKAGAPLVVSVEMPSFAVRQKTQSAPAEKFAAETPRARVTGKRMTVLSAESETVISLFENVRALDADIKIESGKLVVTTDPASGKTFSPTAEKSAPDDFGSVRTVVAEENVRAEQAGRVLRCARADIFPREKRIALSGAPNIVSSAENASLSGDRAEIFLDRDVVEVYSSPAGISPGIRVFGELPPFVAPRAGVRAPAGKTTVAGNRLTLTRADDLSTFDIFGNVVMHSETLTGKCARLVVFADANSKKSSQKSAAPDASKIKKIIADGNVELAQNGYVLTGGRAVITPAVGLKEWVREEGNDGKTPFFVVVEPPPDVPAAARPRISFPGGTNGSGFDLALPSAGSKKTLAAQKKSVAPSDAPTEKSFIESDVMELVAGENRARFFLRGNVELSTDSGAHGNCDSVEGLLAPRASEAASDASSGNFEAKKIICRGNVQLEHDGSRGRGSTLEIFPPENRAVLSGDALLRGKDGIVLNPGNDRFVIDLEKRLLLTGAEAGAVPDAPAQVSRPRIIIPAGGGRVFVVPKSVRGNDEKSEK